MATSVRAVARSLREIDLQLSQWEAELQVVEAAQATPATMVEAVVEEVAAGVEAELQELSALVRAAAVAVEEVEAAMQELAAAQVASAVEAAQAEAAEIKVSEAQEQVELAGMAAADGGAEVQEVETEGFRVVDQNRVFDRGR